MKKEILRIHDLSLTHNAARQLRKVTFCLLAGESTGFIGLASSGKDLLMELLCLGGCSYEGTIRIEGQAVTGQEELNMAVYCVAASNYLIDDWTVAEYITLVSDTSIFGLLSKKTLAEETNRLFEELGLEIDPKKRLRDLTELEKRVIDLAKAYSKGAKILVITDEFEGCTIEEIKQFKKIMDCIIRDQMTVIVETYSEIIATILSDKYIVFKQGQIVKKCNKSYIQNKEQLEKFLLGTTITVQKKGLDSYQMSTCGGREAVYSLSHVQLENGEEKEFHFNKGTVTMVLVLNQKEKIRIFELLSGRKISKSIEVTLESENCDFEKMEDFVGRKIVSIVHMGNLDELLPNMSVGDNLLVPSLKKISAFQYMMAENQLIKMLEKQMGGTLMNVKATIGNMEVNDRIILILERWYVYNPRVLVLFEPFVQCDAYGVSLVKSYIKKFSAMGTAVIIVKSREEYMEDITKTMIYIE